jgi:hypothetical protein
MLGALIPLLALACIFLKPVAGAVKGQAQNRQDEQRWTAVQYGRCDLAICLAGRLIAARVGLPEALRPRDEHVHSDSFKQHTLPFCPSQTLGATRGIDVSVLDAEIGLPDAVVVEQVLAGAFQQSHRFRGRRRVVQNIAFRSIDKTSVFICHKAWRSHRILIYFSSATDQI